jgi:5,10-methylenetetrahydromethanopterin reductase
MNTPAFGLNRLDWRSPAHFATDAKRAESLGWDRALIPASSLRLRDPYVNLAFAAEQTDRIGLGVLLDNPVVRHPSVLASSAATVDELAPGRTLLGLGIGDAAVRLAGVKPANMAELEAATGLVAHPMPTPEPGGPRPDYMERFAREIMPALR